MIKRMLSVNGRISHDVSRDDTTWLKKPELNVEKVFNWQISRSWELLVEVTYGLSEEESRKIGEQEDKKGKCFLIER